MTFAERIRGALSLQPAAFEEIEANSAINEQALAIVIASSIATGIGTGEFLNVVVMIRSAAVALFLWVVWAAVTYVVGTRLLPEPQTKTDMGELLRVFGFASTPALFSVFGAIPILGLLVWPVVGIWVFCATVIAVRQALDYRNTMRAVGAVLVGWVIVLFIQWLVLR